MSALHVAVVIFMGLTLVLGMLVVHLIRTVDEMRDQLRDTVSVQFALQDHVSLLRVRINTLSRLTNMPPIEKD